MGLRYEAWTLPWDTSGFKRKVAIIPTVEGSGQGTVGFLSPPEEGSVDVALGNWDRLSEIISDTESSLIRVYDASPTGTQTIIDEWMAERVPRLHDENRSVNISGGNLLTAFDRTHIYPWDYPKQPSTQQDHIWGGAEGDMSGGLLTNGGFEQSPMPNGGFEDGNVGSWDGTESNGDFIGNGSIVAINNSTDARSGNWYGLVIPQGIGGGARISIFNLIAGETYSITGWIREPTGGGHRIRAGVAGATNATHTNAYLEDEYWWAEIGNATQGNGSTTGAYQSITITFAAGGSDTELVVLWEETSPLLNFYLDDFTCTGDNVGISPWVAHQSPNSGTVVQARVSTTNVHSGLQSLHFQGIDRPRFDAFGRVGYGTIGVHQPVSLTVGKLYTFTAWVRHNGTGTNGANEYARLVISRITPRGPSAATITGTWAPAPGSYHMANKTVLVASGVWTKLSLTFIADVSEVRAMLVYAGSIAHTNVGNFTSPTMWWDDVSLHEGLPATSIGDIWQSLLDDAAVDHAGDTRGAVLDWIDYSSFSDSLDSNGNAWNEAELSFTASWGSTYGNVLDDTYNRGYEAELIPKAIPSGGLTHDFNLYNPGGRDDNPSAAIHQVQPLLGGEALKRIPVYTTAMIASSAGDYTEDSDATAVSNFGRLETFVFDNEASGLVSRQLLADNLFAFETANRKAVQYSMVEAPGVPRPLVHYRPGDTIPMTLSPGLAKEDRRVQRVDYVNTQPTQYVVVGSRVIQGEAAAFDLVRRMWRRMNRPRRHPRETGKTSGGEGGEGGTITVVVAAFDANLISKRKADYVCVGADDQIVIQQAIDSIPPGFEGRVLLSEGTFIIENTPAGGAAITLPSRVHLEGIGYQTVIYDNNLTDPGNPDTTLIELVVGNGFHLSNFFIQTIYDTCAIRSPLAQVCNNVRIHDVFFEVAGRAYYGYRGFGFQLYDCFLNGQTADNHLVDLFGTTDVYIIRNWLYRGKRAINIVDGGISQTPHNIHIGDNILEVQGEEVIWIDAVRTGVAFAYIHDNFIQSAGDQLSAYQNTGAIHIAGLSSTFIPTSGFPVSMHDNHLDDINWLDGIRVEGCHLADIHDNFMAGVERSGIYLLDCSATNAHDNSLVFPDGDNVGDAIAVVGTGDRNRLHDNLFINYPSQNKQWRYAISLTASTVTNTMIYGNDYGDPAGYATGVLNDVGTDTQIFLPSDPTYGDNFTGAAGAGTGAGAASNTATFSQSGTLAVGTGTFKLPFTIDATIISVMLGVATSPTGADLIIDVNKNGTTIFTTQANRPRVVASDADGIGAETTPDVTSVSQGEYLTVDIDQIGSTVAGADLTVVIEWRPA